MDKEGNPVVLEASRNEHIGIKDDDGVYNTFGNSTAFGSQGAASSPATSVCPDSLAASEQAGLSRFSQDSSYIPSTQEEESVLASDPSYCRDKCITVDSIKTCGKIL
jgi:hypothetical protein